MSFQITVKPNRRAAAKFVGIVRRAILRAYVEEQKARGLTQTAIARALGVHRSVINRELRGQKDMTIGRIGELAWAMGRKPSFDLPVITKHAGANAPAPPQITSKVEPLGSDTFEVIDDSPRSTIRFAARAA